MTAERSRREAGSALAEVFRNEAGRITASLIKRFGDFNIAEESTQDAVVAALEAWPEQGVPNNPGAWLLKVAYRRALNRLERDKRLEAKISQLHSEPTTTSGDDRLLLILMCCHPAIARESQVCLTLRAVCGFTTAEIARAFLTSEATVAQRIVRAKRRVASAGIPFRMPNETELGERLGEVLAVLYLLFNEGHLSTSGDVASQRPLSEEAAWLTDLLLGFLSEEPEIMGLLALMKLHLARGSSRFNERGEIVLLGDQDRSSWDHRLVGQAVALIERAAALRRVGPYQLEAAIAACHMEAPSADETDWPQVLVLYDMLLAFDPSAVVRLNRAIALSRVQGPAAGLKELDEIAAELDGYYLLHAARGYFLTEIGREEQARAAQLRALELTSNIAERALIQARLRI